MERRKIQLIAGTSYSVTLPKDWIKRNNLRKKNEVLIYEKNDGSLTISPTLVEGRTLTDFSLNVDDIRTGMDQLLFITYYLGFENITLYSKKGLTKDIRAIIRNATTYMVGTEITYEDENKIIIKVLLDKSKINIVQVLYRISLIIDASIVGILEGINTKEMELNETEVDRLYHLTAKIIKSSLNDLNILNSSGIKNISFVPSYLRISKRLENIQDRLYQLSNYRWSKKNVLKNNINVFQFIRKELSRSMHYLLKPTGIFVKVANEDVNAVKKATQKIKDITVENYLRDIIIYMGNIHEETVNISYYQKLIDDGVI